MSSGAYRSKAPAPPGGAKRPVIRIGILRHDDVLAAGEDAGVIGTPAAVGLLVAVLVRVGNIALVGARDAEARRGILDGEQVRHTVRMAEPQVLTGLNLDGGVCPGDCSAHYRLAVCRVVQREYLSIRDIRAGMRPHVDAVVGLRCLDARSGRVEVLG